MLVFLEVKNLQRTILQIFLRPNRDPPRLSVATRRRHPNVPKAKSEVLPNRIARERRRMRESHRESQRRRPYNSSHVLVPYRQVNPKDRQHAAQAAEAKVEAETENEAPPIIVKPPPPLLAASQYDPKKLHRPNNEKKLRPTQVWAPSCIEILCMKSSSKRLNEF